METEDLSDPGCDLIRRPQERHAGLLLAIVAVCVSFLYVASRADACPVCFGDPDSEMTKGAQWGIVVLGLIVYGVLLGMVGIGATWFIRARKRVG